MLESQPGPFASRVLTADGRTYRLFRTVLLRRLRPPLPVTENSCRCHRRLDPLGDHRAACSTSGVLRSRKCGLERAAARVCREAGARVTSNTRLADLNLAVDRLDDRLVSLLDSAGRPRRRGGRTRGAALVEARLGKERAYPELLRAHQCRLLSSPLRSVAGGARKLRPSSLLARAWALEVPLPFRSAPAAAGRRSCPLRLSCPSPSRVSAGLAGFGGAGPDLSELLADSACPPPLVTRLR